MDSSSSGHYFRQILSKPQTTSNNTNRTPNGYTAVRKRKKRRSKYDVSHIFEKKHDGRWQNNPGQSRFCYDQMLNDNPATCDPTLNLRRQQERTIFSDQQMLILEAAYQKEKHPNHKRREMVAELCGLSVERVRVWYQNRRAKEKRIEVDELAALAKKYCQQEDTAKKSNINSLASINRHINRIFDVKYQNEEEDIIKRIIQNEMGGVPAKKTSANHTSQQHTDRWSHYRSEKVETNSYSSTSDEQQERELVRSFLRNGRTDNTQSTTDHRLPLNKRKRKHDNHQSFEEHESSVNSYSKVKTENSEPLLNPTSMSINCESNMADYGRLPSLVSFPSIMPLDIASLDKMSESEQLYLLHLMNQRQALLNQYQIPDGPQPTLTAPFVDAYNDFDTKWQASSLPTQTNVVNMNTPPVVDTPKSWTEFLHSNKPLLPSMNEAFSNQYPAKHQENLDKFKTTGGGALKKYTQQDAMTYEFVRKTYEKEKKSVV